MATAALFFTSLYAAGDEIFYCYKDMTAIFDTTRALSASFSDPATEKEYHHYTISLNLTKKQIGYEDHFADKDVWLDAKVQMEEHRWIFASPLIEFSEAAPEMGTIYLDQETLSFTAMWRRFPEVPNFNELLVVESGRCEKRNAP